MDRSQGGEALWRSSSDMYMEYSIHDTCLMMGMDRSSTTRRNAHGRKCARIPIYCGGDKRLTDLWACAVNQFFGDDRPRRPASDQYHCALSTDFSALIPISLPIFCGVFAASNLFLLSVAFQIIPVQESTKGSTQKERSISTQRGGTLSSAFVVVK